MKLNRINVARLYEHSILPVRKNSTDAGLDLFAYCIDQDELDYRYVLDPGDFAIINTGITIEIPKGYVGQIWPKSRSNFLIGGGVVDSGYQGEILVKVISVAEEVTIQHGDAIAQLLIVPIETPEVIELPLNLIHSTKSTRGVDGGILRQTYVQTKLDL